MRNFALEKHAAWIANEELTAKERRAIRNARPLSGASGDWIVEDADLAGDLAYWPTGRLTKLGLAVREYLAEASNV